VWRSLQRLAERGLVTRERYPNLTKVGGMLLDYLVWRDSPRAPEFNL
jgi:predicted transcriptional regulator